MSGRAIELLIVMVLSGTVVAQEAARGTIPVSGSELFRYALHQKHLTPLTKPVEALQDPQGTIIVILGDTNNLGNHFRQGAGRAFREFVARGGAILIASDTPTRFQGELGWGQVFGRMEVTGQAVTARADRCYNGDPHQPFVKPRLPAVRGLQRSPFQVFADVSETGTKAIATDRPSLMSMPQQAIPECDVESLASYPEGSRVQQTNQLVPPHLNHFAVSIRHQFGPGRILVMADNGVFANGMMGFPNSYDGTGELILDNGNWAFTQLSLIHI